MLVQSWEVWTVTSSLPLIWASTWPSWACVSSEIGGSALLGRLAGCEEAGSTQEEDEEEARVGGCAVYSSLRAGLVLPYRLVLTLTPQCGPRVCPQALPPFLAENRKLWLYLLHVLGVGRDEHPTQPHPCPLPW